MKLLAGTLEGTAIGRAANWEEGLLLGILRRAREVDASVGAVVEYGGGWSTTGLRKAELGPAVELGLVRVETGDGIVL